MANSVSKRGNTLITKSFAKAQRRHGRHRFAFFSQNPAPSRWSELQLMNSYPTGSSSHSTPSIFRSPATRRILYADDMPELRKLMEHFLTLEGYHADTVQDGQNALARLQAQPRDYDLLITDHHMPQMNGLELVTRLRKGDYCGKIIVFSSELNEDIDEAYQQLRVDCVLKKPVMFPELRVLVRELLRVSQSGTQAPSTRGTAHSL